MVGADLGGAVGGGLAAGGRQARQQPRLPLRAVLVGSGQPLAEALPGGLLGYSDPMPNLCPRASRVARIRYEVADQVVGARCQLIIRAVAIRSSGESADRCLTASTSVGRLIISMATT
jgi:hypothetical protein